MGQPALLDQSSERSESGVADLRVSTCCPQRKLAQACQRTFTRHRVQERTDGCITNLGTESNAERLHARAVNEPSAKLLNLRVAPPDAIVAELPRAVLHRVRYLGVELHHYLAVGLVRERLR